MSEGRARSSNGAMRVVDAHRSLPAGPASHRHPTRGKWLIVRVLFVVDPQPLIKRPRKSAQSFARPKTRAVARSRFLEPRLNGLSEASMAPYPTALLVTSSPSTAAN